MEAGERAVAGKRDSGGAWGSKKALLALVIPTRNEADNVPVLVRELRKSLSGVDYRLVFVDDSTDETPEVIRELGEEDERVTLIHRRGTERGGGLSTAVTTGIEEFAEISEYTCVMDADLQHPPEKVREMLELARSSDGCRGGEPLRAGWQLHRSSGADAPGYLRGEQVPGPDRVQRGAQDQRSDDGVLPGPQRGHLRYPVPSHGVQGTAGDTGLRSGVEGGRGAAQLPRPPGGSLEGHPAPGSGVPGAHDQPVLVRALGGPLLEVRHGRGLGGIGEQPRPDHPRRVLPRAQGHSLDVRRGGDHPEQFPLEQRLHLA